MASILNSVDARYIVFQKPLTSLFTSKSVMTRIHVTVIPLILYGCETRFLVLNQVRTQHFSLGEGGGTDPKAVNSLCLI
jgi:hypothetical protein